MKIGRNAPCHCGSGKKYKKCCLKSDQLAGNQLNPEQPFPSPIIQGLDAKFENYRTLEADLGEAMFFHSDVAFGKEAFRVAWKDFCGDDATQFDPELTLMTIFMPWYLYNWTKKHGDETVVLKSTPAETTVAESFLDKYGEQLPPEEIALLKAANRRPLSFFEIKEVPRGMALRVRDILLEEDIEIDIRTGAHPIDAGDILFGSHMHIDEFVMTLAESTDLVWPNNRAAIVGMRSWIKESTGTAKLTEGLLSGYEIELIDLYLELIEQQTNPPPPKLHNT